MKKKEYWYNPDPKANEKWIKTFAFGPRRQSLITQDEKGIYRVYRYILDDSDVKEGYSPGWISPVPISLT